MAAHVQAPRQRVRATTHREKEEAKMSADLATNDHGRRTATDLRRRRVSEEQLQRFWDHAPETMKRVDADTRESSRWVNPPLKRQNHPPYVVRLSS
jgi:hypothetical protein